MYEYVNLRRELYKTDEWGDLLFIPVCPKCGRFVKADKAVTVNGLGEYVSKPNATCKKDGRVEMPFEGFF
jgi:hypothetical protein